LELGCGSSNFAEKLVALKYSAITCLDFSKEIIKNKQKHAKEGITYKVHDILQPLPFQEGSFDAVIEKNTIDCLFCFEDYPAKVLRVIKECYRVLKEGGVMLSFSHGK
jgi:ubiquinone/menaquinone biosynthesis C-methylase UbiE